MRYSILALLLLPMIAHAEVIEKWECVDFPNGKEVIAIASVDKGRKTGTIQVAGVTYDAAYKISGFERLWLFGDDPEDKDKYGYFFKVEPNGMAIYYEYSLLIPKIKMKCKNTK